MYAMHGSWTQKSIVKPGYLTADRDACHSYSVQQNAIPDTNLVYTGDTGRAKFSPTVLANPCLREECCPTDIYVTTQYGLWYR